MEPSGGCITSNNASNNSSKRIKRISPKWSRLGAGSKANMDRDGLIST
jgi:hypothetical protein